MSAPAFAIDPRIVSDQGAAGPPSSPELPPHDSALADSDDEIDDVAPASAVPRRFSRKESKGASSSEVRRLSSSSPSNSGKPRKPSFTNSLKPSSVFHLDEGVLLASSVSTSRRPSHSSSPSPALLQPTPEVSALPQLVEHSSFTVEDPTSSDNEDGGRPGEGRDTGSLYSTRGALILAVIGASQMLDNVSMTSVNMALTAISKELHIAQADEQWLISAYTLTFGGFLLLSGVFADRWGKKIVFLAGMIWLSFWTLLNGFAKTEIQLIVFRALQGMGAAATVPSAVGIISQFFVGRERNYALAIFGACGAVGFVVGLVYGGVLTTLLGWRWVFWLTCPIGALVSGLGMWLLPKGKTVHDGPKPSMDFLGAGLGTAGLILLTFVLSSGGVYGWGKGFIIAILVISVTLLVAFAFAEKKVSNPLLPSHLWKMPNFAATWILGFIIYCWWQSLVLYLTILSQNVLLYSPLQTAIRFIPMGPMGLATSYFAGWSVNHFKIKNLIILGFALSMISAVPAAVMKPTTSYWASVFPASMIGVTGISVVYNVVSISMMSSVPPAAKSLAGGLINTAFQIGSGFGLAICAAVVTGTTRDADLTNIPSLLKGYQNALWTTVGFCGLGLVLSVFGIKGGMLEVAPGGGAAVH